MTAAARPHARTWNVSPATLARDVLAALVVSLTALSFYISASSLLFQGALAPHLPLAIGAALAGAAVMGLYAAGRVSMPHISVGAEPATVPVLATMTTGIAAAVPGPALLPTAVAALALTGLLVGAAWWLMGRRGGGDVIRYIPDPVIGGFLGSVGWLMLTGGLGVAMAQSFTLQRLLAWATGAADLRLAVALAIGVLIWRTLLRAKHVLVLPGLIVGSALAVHAGLALAGLDLATAREQGWLLKSTGQTLPAWPAAPDLLQAVQWGAVLQQSGLMMAAIIVATLSLLLSDTSLEVAWEARADINRDLRALGQGNLLAVAVGGLTGGISISRSMMNRAAGAAGRGSGVVLALLCLLAMLWGGPVIALVPRPLLGGMLIYLGLGMLKTWVLDSRSRLPVRDHATILVMVVVTATAGFLPAVCVGVLACCLDFALSSAQLSPVRRRLRRSAWPSRVERSAEQTAFLQAQGERVCILELQGVLFFGSATQLVAEVERLLDDPAPPAQLLLDFRQVRWVDSSAAQALGRLFKRAAGQGVVVVLSAASAAVQRALAAAGATGPVCHADIDAALLAWDEVALAQAQQAPPDFEAWLQRALPAGGEPGQASRMLAAMDTLQLAPGQRLFTQGEPSDALYLLRSGRLVALVQADGASPGTLLPVRTITPGGVVGEMGLFRDVPRSATIQAEQASVVLRLGQERLRALEREDPPLAASLYRVFLGQLAGRLDQLTAQAAALVR